MTLNLLPSTPSQVEAAYLDAFAQHNLRVQQSAISTAFVYAPIVRPITMTCLYCRSHIAAGPTNCPNCGAAL